MSSGFKEIKRNCRAALFLCQLQTDNRILRFVFPITLHICLLVGVYVSHCFRSRAKNSSKVAKGLFFWRPARSCIVALHSWFSIKAKPWFKAVGQPVVWGRRQGRLSYGAVPGDMQQFAPLCGLLSGGSIWRATEGLLEWRRRLVHFLF